MCESKAAIHIRHNCPTAILHYIHVVGLALLLVHPGQRDRNHKPNGAHYDAQAHQLRELVVADLDVLCVCTSGCVSWVCGCWARLYCTLAGKERT